MERGELLGVLRWRRHGVACALYDLDIAAAAGIVPVGFLFDNAPKSIDVQIEIDQVRIVRAPWRIGLATGGIVRDGGVGQKL